MLVLLTVFVLGLCAGSFIYAFTLRLYDGRDWVGGRSECETCKHRLQWYDLIPLASWLSTAGKCRYCQAKVGLSYPAAELATGVIFAITYVWWPYDFGAPYGIAFALWLVMVSLMISHIIFDLKWYLMPDVINYALITIAGVSQVFVITYTQDWSRLPGIFAGVGVAYGLFMAMYHFSRGRYIGGGDVKYAPFIGIITGSALQSMFTISIASLLGTLFVLPLLIMRKTKLTSEIPFGPFLVIATYIVVMFGPKLTDVLTTTYLFP